MGDHDGVASRAFSGAEAQQFIFEPHPTRSGVYCIQSVASGLYLYKSNHKQYDHDCLRQSTNPGEDDDRFHYSLNLLAPVITPAHRGLVRDPTRDPIPPPPKPLNADQMPPSPLPVLLGETLLPFYQNSDDPDAVGNLRRYQVDERQYYVMKREQYWKFNPPVIRPVPNQQTEVTITHEAGLTEIEQDTVTKHTGLTLNTNKDVNASVSAKKATVSVSHSFGATFQHDTTSTFFTSEQTDQRVTKTVTLSFFANSFPSMVLYWILVDRWSIGEDVWENPTLIGQATSYPENSSVEATSDV